MARMLLKALRKAGFAPDIYSTLRSFDAVGDQARQEVLRERALREADAIIAAARSSLKPPRLWFSYHVYYKSPDWIGPKVSEALNIPYVVAEGSRAAKRAGGPWGLGHAGAEQALDKADIIFAMTKADEEALLAHKPPSQTVLPLPPFIDIEEWPDIVETERDAKAPARLLAVAMMRNGDKLQSYRQLALALRDVRRPWRLDIVGDGPARHDVEELFEPFRKNVFWHGRITDKARLAEFYANADILFWPAVNEAYGMVFLEAHAFGCPAIAGNHGGVSSVVRDGETGILTRKDDMAAFSRAVETLMVDAALRQKLSKGARAFVRTERTLDKASDMFNAFLWPLAERRSS